MYRLRQLLTLQRLNYLKQNETQVSELCKEKFTGLKPIFVFPLVKIEIPINKK